MEHVDILTNLAVAFLLAWLLGLIAYRFKLSPMVGYILAGFLVGPNTIGYVGDIELVKQLADIGIIFLMFGVGLHFKFSDLYNVRWVAIPGAICQSTCATILGTIIFSLLGLELNSAIVLGMSISVASTVVLVRVLEDNGKLATHSGHVAVGWLIVEDLIAVVALILLPIIGGSAGDGANETNLLQSLGMAFLKLGMLVLIMFVAGSKLIPRLMVRVAKLRSREMFTLTILVFSITIAASAAKFFGASIALGAFLAGMLVAQSPTSHQAASNALPLQDTFAVIFFVSAGMLLNVNDIQMNPWFFISMLVIILLIKPVVVTFLTLILGQPFKTALTVGLGLTQIGEFSFIMVAIAKQSGLISDVPYSSVIAAAIVCISISPILNKLQNPIENKLKCYPKLWKILNYKAYLRMQSLNKNAIEGIAKETTSEEAQLAIVIGYGVFGQGICKLLKKSGLKVVVIDTNMGTISRINERKCDCDYAIFGDATNANILSEAGIAKAKYLLVTMAMASNPAPIIEVARSINPKIQTFVRGRFVTERDLLVRSGASHVVFDEAESAIAMGRTIIEELGGKIEDYQDEFMQIRLSLGY